MTKPYTSRAELQGRWPEGHHAKRFTTERKGLNLAPYGDYVLTHGKENIEEVHPYPQPMATQDFHLSREHLGV